MTHSPRSRPPVARGAWRAPASRETAPCTASMLRDSRTCSGPASGATCTRCRSSFGSKRTVMPLRPAREIDAEIGLPGTASATGYVLEDELRLAPALIHAQHARHAGVLNPLDQEAQRSPLLLQRGRRERAARARPSRPGAGRPGSPTRKTDRGAASRPAPCAPASSTASDGDGQRTDGECRPPRASPPRRRPRR